MTEPGRITPKSSGDKADSEADFPQDSQSSQEQERRAEGGSRDIRRLAQEHGKVLGKRRSISTTALLKTLDKQFREIYRRIAKRTEAGDKGTRAEEWLLDNRHIVQESLEVVRESLPGGFVRQLPQTLDKEGHAVIRIKQLAEFLIQQEQLPLDMERIRLQLSYYQSHCILTIGELWAFPAYLRLILLQKLAQSARDALTAEQSDAETRTTEHDPVDVAGAVISLRYIQIQNWRRFIESVSHVGQILASDPAASYALMDFESRDHYRGIVEQIARRTRQPEHVVAKRAVQLSEAQPEGSRQHHVGYYLLDEGRRDLEKLLGCRYKWRHRLARAVKARASTFYFTCLSALVLPLLVGLVAFLASSGVAAWLVVLVSLLAIIPITGLALALFNGLVTHILPPHRLPKLNFEKGLATDCRTAVIMPVLLSDADDIASIISSIELNYLNNDDKELVYVVLSDFADADQEECAEDGDLLVAAEQAINDLNQRHMKNAGRPPFLFLHRRRCWNESENRWMGWERKRGKLIEFNRLLKSDEETSFTHRIGDLNELEGVRFVITLDADTQMPPGIARRMVGALAHPLNKAVVDPTRQRVVAGYGFLQPRLDIQPDSAGSSPFSKIYSGDHTVDLYTHAVSDTFQDLLGEGIFAGKGIYDPKVFEQTLAGLVPDNSVLSHDLLEGTICRVALISDATLYEQYPPNIFAYMRRAHRWIRGDWQLLPWLRRKVPAAGGQKVVNSLPWIHQWKIIDNLRRSLEAPSYILLFIFAWTGLLPGSGLAWTLGIVALTATPLWIEILTALWRSVASLLKLDFRQPISPPVIGLNMKRWLLMLVLLPYESYFVLDAVLRTLYRLVVSRRHLLEWTSAAHVNRAMGQGLSIVAAWQEMWMSPLLASILAIAVVMLAPANFTYSLPLLLAWFCAPWVAITISRPARITPEVVSEEDVMALRVLARRTWHFFEKFMGPDDHWLPPDNYQEEPLAVLARRTSPTNIGLGLLATLSAYDFGYLDCLSLLARLNNNFDRMRSLERYRGHFLNWYETRELKPLQPRYVSTVDSGNLAGSLLTLARGLEEMLAKPISGRQLVAGVVDTLAVVEETLQPTGKEPASAERLEIIGRIRDVQAMVKANADERSWWQVIDQVYEVEVPILHERILQLVESNDAGFSSEGLGRLRQWIDELHRQAIMSRRNQEKLEPWWRLFEYSPGFYKAATTDKTFLAQYQALEQALSDEMSLQSLPSGCETALKLLAHLEHSIEIADIDKAERERLLVWNRHLAVALQASSETAQKLIQDMQKLIDQADLWVKEMDFGFLYDESRHLFRIGYNVNDAVLDSNYYDLLASEARIAGFLAIAKGDVPAKHWRYLERPFRRLHGEIVLMSWGATLFEYLMPRLLIKTPHNSLLEQACRNAVGVHQRFTRKLKLPWGISESGYYQLDTHNNYQYRAFGAPGIGFRRDVGDRVVISPYSSIMALPFASESVIRNLKAIRALRGYGQFGLYEAIDFGRTAKAVPRRARIVRSYMSHHQGMIMLALNNFLHADIMLHRFHSDARIDALTPLLHEGMPATTPALTPWTRPDVVRSFRPAVTLESWWAPLPLPQPQYNLLSNGHYSLIQTADGGGGSRWQDIVLTRWRPDSTRDACGHWCYIKDLDSGHLFSVGHAPCGQDVNFSRVHFGPHRTEFQHRQAGLFCRLKTVIASQRDIEVRRLIIKNENAHKRRLFLGSYAEVVLAKEQEDERHPAFAKLFIESEYLAREETMLYRRRPRSTEEKPIYMAHSVLIPPGINPSVVWETDRQKFLGRGGTVTNPQAIRGGLGNFTGTTGAVLDPVLATGVEVELGPHEEIEIVYLTGVAKSRRELVSVIHSYRSAPRVQWAFSQARMQSEQELHTLRIAPSDIRWMMDLMSAVLAPTERTRVDGHLLDRSEHILSTLWSRGISGDNPILLVQIRSVEETGFVETIVQAHTYWCGRGMSIDLVLIDEDSGGYQQPVRDRLQQLIDDVRNRTHRKISGAIYILAGREIHDQERVRLMAAARVVLDSSKGSVAMQLGGGIAMLPHLPPFVPVRNSQDASQPTPVLPRPTDLQFDNGMGGFSADGKEYVLHMENGSRPPAPWSNVIANPNFGCLVTEGGSACTWSGNSGEHRLTAWQNDPVSDPSGEILYLRDEETAEIWSPTPAPCPADGAYQVRHGAGYSEYLHHSHGLKQAWRVYVDRDAPVKIGRLTLTNCWRQTRRITATYYLEWVLGLTRASTWPYIASEYVADCGALFARNAFTRDAKPGVAFLTSSLPVHGLTTDRTEFLGRSGNYESPAAMFRVGLSGKVENGGDHCAAYQVHIDLPPDTTEHIYFVMGEAEDREAAIDLATRFKAPEQAEAALHQVREFWEDHFNRIQIETPDRATDLMVNRWLPYQTLACRLWGRSGYYQSSGAFGFRDQLQDVLSLLWSQPQWTREHILKAASRQFQDGDVLHWWHEHPLRGVRTRCSDDLLWLPYVTARYVSSTGDFGILRESVSYLQGEALARDEAEHFAEFEQSNEAGSLYEHCCRAIERATAVGPHGLPVIGNGDWNDGFNRISTTGRGESVWLGWFLARVCKDFVPLCEHSGDSVLAGHYQDLAEAMLKQIDKTAWDGAWYRRAYFDDGTPVGSNQNEECKIDLIAQAWSVMASDTPSERSREAMASAYRHLVREDDQQILLLTPPFNLTKKDPGYIKGYPPGIRENGGQYTHGANWAVWAMAKLGDAERAMTLFSMLNPIRHADTPEGVQRYRTEPYVLAGDIYSVPPHVGRGGWSWYSGASGWLQRAALEALLGLELKGDHLNITPCLPASWQAFNVSYQHGRTRYDIKVKCCGSWENGQVELLLDGERIGGSTIPLVDDGNPHSVQVTINSES